MGIANGFMERCTSPLDIPAKIDTYRKADTNKEPKGILYIFKTGR